MKSRKPLDWELIWAEFEAWYRREITKGKRCRTCGHKESTEPDWPDQQAAIQRFVEESR